MSDLMVEALYVLGCITLTYILYLIFGAAASGYLILFMMLWRG